MTAGKKRRPRLPVGKWYWTKCGRCGDDMKRRYDAPAGPSTCGRCQDKSAKEDK